MESTLYGCCFPFLVFSAPAVMRIRSKDTLSEGLLIPVWDFWGTVSYHAADSAYSDVAPSREEYTVAMTVNAIDGTIVDRESGY